MDKRMLIVTLIAILCVVVGILALYACAAPPDPMYATIDDNVFAPQVWVDDAHDVVCYRDGNWRTCVYIGK